MAKDPKTEEQETPAAPQVPATLQAVVHDTADEIVCRPPPGVAVHTLGQVVIGNWRGHVNGKAVSVAHCTPVAGLPSAVLSKLRATPEQKIGPFDPRKKPDPQQPSL